MNTQAQQPGAAGDAEAQRRSRSRRLALALGLLALAFYLGFILMQLLSSRHG